MPGQHIWVTVLLGCLMVGGLRVTEEHSKKIRKRWIGDFEWKNITHIRLTNSWYQYATMLAKNHTGCYVCSRMPVSTKHPSLLAQPLTDYKEADCVEDFMLGGNGTNYHYMTKVNNGTHVYTTSQPAQCQAYRTGNISGVTEVSAYADLTGEGKHSNCYFGDGTVEMGSCGKRCQRLYFYHEDAPKKALKAFWQICKNLGHTNCQTVSNPALYTQGTIPVDGYFWMCGHRIYLSLPPQWKGICAPVKVTDHTYLVWAVNDNSSLRMKRMIHDVAPHDAIWGSDVPEEHKLWSVAEKVVLSVFPQIGVGKLSLRMETMNYRLGLFLNATTDAFRSLSEEMTEIRLMTLQNRMVLDLLVAPQGGVCAMINTSCCTYIPDNTQDGHDVANAIHQLKNIQSAMTQDSKTSDASWWSWFFPGPWWTAMLRGAVIVISVLICVCLLFACCIPCIQGLIRRMVTGTMIMYTQVIPDEESAVEQKDINEDDSEDEDLNGLSMLYIET